MEDPHRHATPDAFPGPRVSVAFASPRRASAWSRPTRWLMLLMAWAGAAWATGMLPPSPSLWGVAYAADEAGEADDADESDEPGAADGADAVEEDAGEGDDAPEGDAAGDAEANAEEEAPEDEVEEAEEAEAVAPVDPVVGYRRLAQQGKYDEALLELKGLSTAAADALHAEILTDTGRLEEASKLLASALRRFPTDPDLRYARGRLYLATGQYAKAEAALKPLADGLTAVDTPPARAPLLAKLDLARLYDLLGRLDPMERQLDWFFERYGVVEDDNLSAEEAMAIGVAGALGQDFENGIKIVALAQKKAPRYPLGFIEVGEMFLEKYQYPDAEKEFRAALKINPKDPRALVGLAETVIHRRDLGTAMSKAKEALETNPAYLRAHRILAAVAFIDEKPDEALAHIDAGLAYNPNHPEALIQRAAIQYLEGRETDYAATVTRLAAVYNGGPLAEGAAIDEVSPIGAGRLYLAVSSLLAESHRIEEALAFAKKALNLDRDDAAILAHLGITLMRHGLEEEAKEYLDLAYEYDPYNVWVYNLRKLVDRNTQYNLSKTNRFVIRLHKPDEKILGPLVRRQVEKQLAAMEKLYGYRVKDTIRLAILKSQPDFAARVTGLPRLDANGATFGPYVALVSPMEAKKRKSPDNWLSVQLHELAHVVTLKGSNYRVPRWLTEGMSVHAEGWINPQWDTFLKALLAREELPPLDDFNRYFNRPKVFWEVPAAYSAAGLFVRWFTEEYGEEKLRRVLVLYGEGKKTDAVFQEVTGKPLPELTAWWHAKLRDYDKTLRPPMASDPAKLAEHKRSFENNEDLDAALELLRVMRVTGNLGVAKQIAEQLVGEKAGEKWKGFEHQAFHEAALTMAEAALHGKDPEGARAFLDTAKAHGETGPRYLHLEGLIALERGDLKTARERFHAALKAYPRFVQGGPVGNPYHGLIRIAVTEERQDDAIQLLEDYYEIRRDDPEAIRKLAELYTKREKFKEAADAYERLFAVDPYEYKDRKAYVELLEAHGPKDRLPLQKAIKAAIATRFGIDENAPPPKPGEKVPEDVAKELEAL